MIEDAIFKRNINIGDTITFQNESIVLDTKRVGDKYHIIKNGKPIHSYENFQTFLKKIQEITIAENLKME